MCNDRKDFFQMGENYIFRPCYVERFKTLHCVRTLIRYTKLTQFNYSRRLAVNLNHAALKEQLFNKKFTMKGL